MKILLYVLKCLFQIYKNYYQNEFIATKLCNGFVVKSFLYKKQKKIINVIPIQNSGFFEIQCKIKNFNLKKTFKIKMQNNLK